MSFFFVVVENHMEPIGRMGRWEFHLSDSASTSDANGGKNNKSINLIAGQTLLISPYIFPLSSHLFCVFEVLEF